MLINCIGSLFKSSEPSKARVEIVGRDRKVLAQLQQSLYARLSSNSLNVSAFVASSAEDLQVILYNKGKTLQIYKGSSTVDPEEIAMTVANNL